MKSDFLVIGSGIAGLSFALRVADRGSVVLITKKKTIDTATNLAQGGIAAVIDKNDSHDSHIADTLRSGDGLCDYKTVVEVVTAGKSRVDDLIRYGVSFVKEDSGDELSLGREGGHSHRRIAHAYDLTGNQIEMALLHKISLNKNVILLENHVVVDLLMTGFGMAGRCVGARILNASLQLEEFRANYTVLCTGGSGKVYLYTSNPDIATGDGVAIAYRAGAAIANMEFVQFHPTCLYHPHAKNFLISEAVRGEGARLITSSGVPFMKKYDERGELATRDIVARSIDREMKESGADCVYLDVSVMDSAFIRKRFPTIYEECQKYGIDITRDPLPVVPAAHYQCGGILVDNWGRTSIDHLIALGEVACTGLHGANRLASNSLLEAVVFAERAARFCLESPYGKGRNEKDINEESYRTPEPKERLEEEILVNHNWDSIRRIMWNYVGIVRSDRRLDLAYQRLVEINGEIENIYMQYRLTRNMIELRNISHIAMLIVESARQRKESRGLHFSIDHPQKDDKNLYWTVLTRCENEPVRSFNVTRKSFSKC